MDVPRYLERIRYPGDIRVDYHTLRDLTLAHQYAVPMENFDIHLGIPVRLTVNRFYDKIVERHRGGGCYELNGLFGALLREVGFSVDLLSAQVIRPHRVGPEFDHLALRVTLDNRAYLVDVGFGDGIREPMEMLAGTEQRFDNRVYRLGDGAVTSPRQAVPGGLAPGTLRLEIHQQGEFDKGCLLSLVPRRLDQFEAARHEHPTDPQSWFVCARVATLATPTGRLTLLDNVFKVRENGELTVIRVRNDAHYMAILRDRFGLYLPRVPRTKGNRLSMRIRRQGQIWRHRANKLVAMTGRAIASFTNPPAK